jgi:quercetin 2,3-dioxygenase
MITTARMQVREPDTIYQASGEIANGTFRGRWHFSFDQYYDPAFLNFGMLRVFNDDTLSAGAIWPLHPHREIEVVTYCAGGEFRHEDEHGLGGVLHKGDVQHTTVGRGMWHSEINNRPDEPMRFVQMWFTPGRRGLEPAVQKAAVQKSQRVNRFLTLVSHVPGEALPIASEARVFSCFLEAGRTVTKELAPGHGAYLYVLEGGNVNVNGHRVQPLGAAMIVGESRVRVEAAEDTELLLVEVGGL